MMLALLVLSQILPIPAGSWAVGTLMTGIYVGLPLVIPDPAPVFIRIDRGFQTPAGVVDLSGCMLIGTAEWLEQISGVVVEIHTLSCPVDGKMFKKRVKGYVWDGRVRFGLKGRILKGRVVYRNWWYDVTQDYVYIPVGRRIFVFLTEGTKLYFRRPETFIGTPFTP